MSAWDTALAAIGTPTYRWDMTSASQPETDLGSALTDLTVEVAPSSAAYLNSNEQDASRDFNGTTAYLGVNADVLGSAVTVATYLMWFNADVVSGFQTLIAQGASGSANAFGAIQVEADGTIAYTVRKNTSSQNLRVATAAGVVVAGNTYFLAVVCTGADNPRIYLNGALLSVTVTATGSVDGFETLGDWTLSTHNRFAIGALRRNTDASFFNGRIDDVVIFHGTAISSRQVAALYAGTVVDNGAATVTYARRSGRRIFGSGFGTDVATTWVNAVNAIGADHWYRFQEASGDLLDEGGSGDDYAPTDFNGQPFNGTYAQSSWTDSNGALQFNGQGCIAQSLSPFGSPANGTLVFLLKLGAGCPSGAWVWMEYDNGDDKAVAFRLMGSNGKRTPVVWLQDAATGDTYLTSTVNIHDGDWHLVALVFTSGSPPVIYVDGVEDTGAVLTVGTTSSSYWIDDFVADGQIMGARGGVSSDTDFFKGSMDEFVFFDSALSGAQIAELYTASGL